MKDHRRRRRHRRRDHGREHRVSPRASAAAPTSSSSKSGEMFGLGSTGLNAGGIRYQFATTVNIELSKLSIGMMERFADEMDQEVGLRRCGYLFMLDSEHDLAQFRANVALQNSLGVPSRVVERGGDRRACARGRLDGIIGGTWCPRDGLVDPNGLLQGYVSNARRLGATLLTEHAGDRHRCTRRTRASRRDEQQDRSRRRPSSSPRARGRRRSVRWPESTCRSSRFGDRSPSPDADSRPATGLSICYRLLTVAVFPSRRQRHSHRNVEPRRAAGIRHARR